MIVTEAIIVAVIAAIPATIAAISSRRAEKQMRPNGGSSLKDSLNRIEAKIDRHLEWHAEH